MPQAKVGKLNDKHPSYREGYEFSFVCECGFFSLGWPTKKQATIRKDQHLLEHEKGKDAIMPPKEEVEALTPDKFRPGNVQPDAQRSPLWDEVN